MAFTTQFSDAAGDRGDQPISLDTWREKIHGSLLLPDCVKMPVRERVRKTWGWRAHWHSYPLVGPSRDHQPFGHLQAGRCRSIMKNPTTQKREGNNNPERFGS